MRILPNIMLSVATVVVCVVIFEIGLQILDWPPAPNFGWGWANSAYKDGASVSDQVNELGYRGQPIKYGDQDFVVVLLGDSNVEAGGQAQPVQPERILQFILQQYGIPNPKVFTVASAGWSLDQELIALKRYFRQYRADAVVHWLTPGNDFWEAGNIDRSTTTVWGPLKPTFVLAPDGSLSLYSVPAFGFKTLHLVNLALSRFRDEHWGNSSIAVHAYEKILPPAGRSPIPIEECPPVGADPLKDWTAITPEALDRSRTHLVGALVPPNAREAYFFELTHALQKEIESEAVSHQSSYLPITVFDRDLDDTMGRMKCAVAKDSGNAYRVDFTRIRALARNPLVKAPVLEIALGHTWSNFISSTDLHANMIGNFDALNQIGQAVAKRQSGSPVESLSTLDLIHRSKLLASVGPELSFEPTGASASQPLLGFYPQESNGRWTNGDATVIFDVGEPYSGANEKIPLTLEIQGHALIYGPIKQSRLEVIVNDEPVTEFVISSERNGSKLCANFEVKQGTRVLEVKLRSKDRARTDELGIAGDPRILGYYLRSLKITPRGVPIIWKRRVGKVACRS